MWESGLQWLEGHRDGFALPRGEAPPLFRLKALGVRLAIDDFGTGYCNLSYLQRFPLDILKIDKTFIAQMATNGNDAALASTIVGLATTLKLFTVAEGVEDAEQRQQLLALGCDHGQGYLFARPVAAGEIVNLLRNGAARPMAREVVETGSSKAKAFLGREDDKLAPKTSAKAAKVA